MKKIILILLFTIPFLGFGQTDSIKKYHENGQLESIGILNNGKKDGVWKEYYKNGQLKKKEKYKDRMLDGESNYYHKNGNLKVINYNWKKWTLYSKYYNIHGQIESEGGFKDIYKDGSWKYYYKDGQIKKEIVWTGMSKSNIISKKCWNENGNKIECEE